MSLLISAALTSFKIYKGSVEKKEIVDKLISLEQEQAKLFDMFANEIKAIQEGPFYTGLTYLEEAAAGHRSKKEELMMLKSASEQFIKAYGIQRAKLKKTAFDVHFIGFIQSYICITWLMLDSPKDALNWMEKSVESLQKGQELFTQDIAGLYREIRSIESESAAYNRAVSDSFIMSGFDFFFGNTSLEEKKRQLPKYRNLVSRYSVAKEESASYLQEMTDLKVKIHTEVDSYEEAKNQLQNKVTGLLTSATQLPNETINKTLDALPVAAKVNDIKGVFSRFKK